jgi:hypothetical protein
MPTGARALFHTQAVQALGVQQRANYLMVFEVGELPRDDNRAARALTQQSVGSAGVQQAQPSDILQVWRR